MKRTCQTIDNITPNTRSRRSIQNNQQISINNKKKSATNINKQEKILEQDVNKKSKKGILNKNEVKVNVDSVNDSNNKEIIKRENKQLSSKRINEDFKSVHINSDKLNSNCDSKTSTAIARTQEKSNVEETKNIKKTTERPNSSTLNIEINKKIVPSNIHLRKYLVMDDQKSIETKKNAKSEVWITKETFNNKKRKITKLQSDIDQNDKVDGDESRKHAEMEKESSDKIEGNVSSYIVETEANAKPMRNIEKRTVGRAKKVYDSQNPIEQTADQVLQLDNSTSNFKILKADDRGSLNTPKKSVRNSKKEISESDFSFEDINDNIDDDETFQDSDDSQVNRKHSKKPNEERSKSFKGSNILVKKSTRMRKTIKKDDEYDESSAVDESDDSILETKYDSKRKSRKKLQIFETSNVTVRKSTRTTKASKKGNFLYQNNDGIKEIKERKSSRNRNSVATGLKKLTTKGDLDSDFESNRIESSADDDDSGEKPIHRKVGRPKKSALEGKQDNKQSKSKKFEDDSIDKSKNKELVMCQVCKKNMTSKEYEKQHKPLHHGLCWTQYDEPIDLFNPKLVLDILYVKRRKYGSKDLKFVCLHCKQLKKSELGYYSHLLVCNRTEEEIEKSYKLCELCDKKIFLPHYHAHELKHEKESTVETEEKNELNLTPESSNLSEGTINTGKRSAAQRAQSKIAKIAENLQDGEQSPSRKRKLEDAEFQMSEGEETLSDEDFTEECTDEEYKSNEDVIDSESGSDEKDGGLDKKDSSRVRRNLVSGMFLPASKLSYGYHLITASFSNDPLFENFSVPNLNILNDATAHEYLPLLKKSVLFEFPTEDPVQLNLFASHLVKNNYILFCGGQIWALAWLPEIFTKKSSDQYLAVAAQKNVHQIHDTNAVEEFKSSIQIWKLPQMSCLETAKKKLDPPKMVLGIAHEEGVVWALEWCPSGGHIPNERLGLLAAACSSGKILIYSVPCEETFLSSDPIIALMEPVRILQLDEDNTTPCRKLVWNKSSLHNIIIAGYGDGSVALYEIIPKLDFLTVGKIVFPLSIFQAHLGSLSVLSLRVTNNYRFLLTAGNDKFTKIWDLDDVSSPVQSFIQHTTTQKRPTSGGFLPTLPIYLTGMDIPYFNDNATLTPSTIRDFSYLSGSYCLRSILTQKAVHYSLSFSNICSSMVTGDEDGRLIGSHFPSTILNVKVGYNGKQFNLIDTKMISINNDINADSSYENTSKKYKLFFSQQNDQRKKKINEEYDLANFISIEWNNNASNFQYIAAGQKCGLVHIINTNLHSQQKKEEFIKAIKKQHRDKLY